MNFSFVFKSFTLQMILNKEEIIINFKSEKLLNWIKIVYTYDK